MHRLEDLKQRVDKLYTSGNPGADVFTDWGYPNHVLVVANLTEINAKRQGADVELAVAGALLHDIADAVMPRKSPGHEAESLRLAGKLLKDSGFNDEDATFVVNEIIKPHSCKTSMPVALEGKVMATADSAAHFLTDFYPLFCWRHYGPQDDYQAFRDWMRVKIEKDFHKKIFFEDVKQEIRPRYEALKLIFLD